MRIYLAIPMNQDFNDVSLIIKQVVEQSKHQLIRIDELMAIGNITEQINDEISKADLIIADVSDNNPNVMFELGLAQSLKKPILPITRRGERIPFDIASIRVLYSPIFRPQKYFLRWILFV